MPHVPVLLEETLKYLNAETGRKFIDGTAGGGGHTEAILKLNPNAKVLAIDWDQTSLDKLRERFARTGLNQRSILVSGNYQNIDKIAAEHDFSGVDGILLDLGFSSLQLDEASRGLSFQNEGPLDMRYSETNPLTAAKIVNEYSQSDLNRIFVDYGEERLGNKIARSIVRARTEKPIQTTTELAEIVKSAIPKPILFRANDNVRRIFQALRIAVNHEFENLQAILPKTLELLNPGGRLVIISFHSLEDRIVKKFLVAESKGCVCPPEFPTCICDKVSNFRILTRKPVTATEKEIGENPRSKPAKLRAAEKLK